jgi:hypothetical protein
LTKIELTLQYIISETTTTESGERKLKATGQKKQITYQGKPIKITAETFKARRTWNEVFQALNENNFYPRIFYSAKPSFKMESPYIAILISSSKTPLSFLLLFTLFQKLEIIAKQFLPGGEAVEAGKGEGRSKGRWWV